MAKFEAVFYVYFMTVDGQVHSTAIANAANDFKVALPTDYEPNGKVVTGWVVGNDAVFTADTVVTADTYVYPVTEDCYWVTFNTTGGSMVASRSVIQGDTLDLSDVKAPTRAGYSFQGWRQCQVHGRLLGRERGRYQLLRSGHRYSDRQGRQHGNAQCNHRRTAKQCV